MGILSLNIYLGNPSEQTQGLTLVPPCRELTEPECDRDQDALEDISGEQLQMELEKIIQDYRRDKQKLHNTEKSKQEKFIISV